MIYNKLGFISASLFSIVLSIELGICYFIMKSNILFGFLHLFIAGCIIYLTLMLHTLKKELDTQHQNTNPYHAIQI